MERLQKVIAASGYTSRRKAEELIKAGANFASAPKRVLIDMLDPIIVAESVAYTPVDKFVPLAGIIANTREGLKGIGGVQTRGQYREGMPGL